MERKKGTYAVGGDDQGIGLLRKEREGKGKVDLVLSVVEIIVRRGVRD